MSYKIKEHIPDIKKGEEIWIKEFFEGLANATILTERKSDVSLRQGYILLDQTLEIFLLQWLKHIKKADIKKDAKKGQIRFDHIISATIDHVGYSKDICYRITTIHDKRDVLQHDPETLTYDFHHYYKDIISLCKLMDIDVEKNVNKIINKSKRIEEIEVITKKSEKCREKAMINLKLAGDVLNNMFGLVHGVYLPDILLGCMPGDTNGAIKNMKMIISGISAMNEEAKILEIICEREDRTYENIDKNEEVNSEPRELEIIFVNTDDNEIIYEHTFLILYFNTWYCFYKCFWSKNTDKEERMDLKDIRKFIKDKDNIQYPEPVYSNIAMYLKRYLSNERMIFS